jgi:hypothetical protein
MLATTAAGAPAEPAAPVAVGEAPPEAAVVLVAAEVAAVVAAAVLLVAAGAVVVVAGAAAAVVGAVIGTAGAWVGAAAGAQAESSSAASTNRLNIRKLFILSSKLAKFKIVYLPFLKGLMKKIFPYGRSSHWLESAL